jgi:membrane-bound ClpP family serine protease
MTTIDETSPRRAIRDWESPGRLLRRYVEAAGIQVFGAMLCVAGFVALVIGWWKISKESIVALQIPYLVSGGIGGALLLGMGGVLLLTHDLRLDNRRLEAVEEALNDLRAALLEEAAREVAPAPTTGFVQVAGGTRFHRADCSAAAGKTVTVLDEQAVAGMVPCRLCSPAVS